MDSRSTTILVCIGLYMASCVGIGLWAMRRTKNTRDFFMAGRGLGIVVTSVAIFSSTMSGFGFVGGPGATYKMAIASFWFFIGVLASYSICFFLLGKRIRLFAELCDSVSLPDVVAARYGSEATRFFTAVAILLGVLGYLASQILAMAVVLQNILAEALDAEVNLAYCLTFSCAVLVFYCVTGGIIASVYTDLIQGVIMAVAAVLIFFTAQSVVDGGFTGMSQTIVADDPEAMGPWGTVGMFGCLSWYFVFVLGLAGQPHIVTKLMMNKRIRDVRHTFPVSALGYCITALLWIGIGLAMRALVLDGSFAPLAHSDDTAPQFLLRHAPSLLAGVVFAGLFAAIMSTADGFLNIGAAAIVHDIPRAFGCKPFERELLWARLATVGLAVLASVIGLYSGKIVALLGAFGWGTFAAALVPTIGIGLNWKRATPLAACVAIVASLVINFAVGISERIFDTPLPHNFHAGALAILVSLTLFFGISLLSPPPKLDPDVEAAMDM